MSTLAFWAVIKIRDGNPYILVDRAKAIKLQPEWKKPMPVLIQINNQPNPPWRINMMPVGNGSFYLYLHGDVRKASQTKVGDKVQVSMDFDIKYRNGPMHPMPMWFKAALAQNAEAKNNWDTLTPSRKKEILRYFSWLKSDQAKQRNIDRVINVLSGKPGRFMARSWKQGK